MADQPRKRPWLQYHLSTALIVALTAGLLLGINIQCRQIADAEALQDHWYTLARQPGHWTSDCRSRDAGFVDYLPYLSVMVLAAVAVACEWLIRRH
jgi:hypothetical protein